MKGNPKVISNLQQAATLESNLSVCYLNYAAILKHFGLSGLASKLKGFGKDARRFQKEMIDRVLFLEGKAEFATRKAEHDDDIKQMFDDLLKEETSSVNTYQDYYLHAQTSKDADTRNLYEHWIKAKEHERINWLEKQVDQIQKLGEGLYVQKHI